MAPSKLWLAKLTAHESLYVSVCAALPKPGGSLGYVITHGSERLKVQYPAGVNVPQGIDHLVVVKCIQKMALHLRFA
jgi:hypothetical protein